MAAERLGVKIGMKEETIKKACGLAMKAHRYPGKPYLVDKSRGEVLFAFAGVWTVSDWYSQRHSKPFGETPIDLKQFPSLKSIGKEEVAVVNDAFMRRFEEVLATSSLQTEVRKAVMEGKQIAFAGHSSGGPIALLATLWCLENCIKPDSNRILPHCVTFGSPLIGNWIFPHALRRENWSDCFLQFIMRYDIVPRILLAPLSSIERKLQPVLQFYNPNAPSFKHEVKDASLFYESVMRNAATVTSHAACNLMGSTNMLLETVTNFIELSPYRPFGTHIFCIGNGKLVTVKNPDAILQLMFYCSQLKSETEVGRVSQKSLEDHLAYERELQESLQMQSVVHLDHLENLPLSVDCDADAATNMALKDLGLSTRARLCLRAAGEVEKQKERNEAKINDNKNKVKSLLTEVEKYRDQSEDRRVGYYDAFKLQRDPRDFQINVKRLELAGVWDEIIEMLKRSQLPDEFETRKEWVELGTRYRRAVEPLDIANYYRHAKDDDTGPYMKKGRPRRYRCTQGWLENYRKVPAGTNSESCFWAEVEQLCNETNCRRIIDDSQGKVLKLEGRVEERLLELEDAVWNWCEGGELCKDVFVEESTFVKWWKMLPLEHRSRSHITSLISP